MDTAALDLDHFAGRIGEHFTARAGDDELALELAEASRLPGGERTTAGFSLLFLHRDQHVRRQQLYEVSHGDLGTYVIFLVPVGQDAAGVQYEAVFTRT